MGLTEALLLIILLILLAQFTADVLLLGSLGVAIVGGIIVAGIAWLILSETLGPDNLSLVIGGALAINGGVPKWPARAVRALCLRAKDIPTDRPEKSK